MKDFEVKLVVDNIAKEVTSYRYLSFLSVAL